MEHEPGTDEPVLVRTRAQMTRRPPPSTPTDEEQAVPDSSDNRRAHLDGLRAVAIYLVVLFHAGSGRFSGGFIGVDVFFVLSGYLVTQVLLRDVANHGSIRLGRFYARRIRRLLPASLIVLAVTAAVYTALATPAEIDAAASAFKASLLYVANWHFAGEEIGYFATDTARNPVLHFWSLAVEEQFYLLWPLVLMGLLLATARLGRRRWTVLSGLVATGALASAAWALVLRGDSPDRAYFGTDTRAYQLLAGAFIALSPMLFGWATRFRRTTRLMANGALVAIIGLATYRVTLDPIERGLAVTLATCVLLVALDTSSTSLTKRLLASSTVSYLGRVSYGTYLWHWPVIIVIEKLTDVAPLPLAQIVALVATGLASLSYHLVEVPVRKSKPLDRIRWPLVAGSLAVSVLAALLVVPRITDSKLSRASTATAARSIEGFTPVPVSFDRVKVYSEFFGMTVDCAGKAPEECTVVRGAGRHVLLMGDSNAEMWIPAFTQMAKQEDLTLSLSVTRGCPWQRHVFKMSQAIIDKCRRTKNDAYDRIIPALRPDLIVVVNARESKGPPSSTYSEDPLNRLLREDTPQSLEELQALTKDILIIEAGPNPTDEALDPLNCLAEAEVVEACRFLAPVEPSWLELQERDIAERSDHIFSADFDRLICPFLPICDAVIGDTVVFWNGQHITTRYSKSLAGDVGRYLKDRRLIPG